MRSRNWVSPMMAILCPHLQLVQPVQYRRKEVQLESQGREPQHVQAEQEPRVPQQDCKDRSRRVLLATHPVDIKVLLMGKRAELLRRDVVDGRRNAGLEDPLRG